VSGDRVPTGGGGAGAGALQGQAGRRQRATPGLNFTRRVPRTTYKSKFGCKMFVSSNDVLLSSSYSSLLKILLIGQCSFLFGSSNLNLVKVQLAKKDKIKTDYYFCIQKKK
jgi:hypothetical protein